jgi:hypothetical protein
MFRISLNSSRLVSGSWNDGYFSINLPVPLTRDDSEKKWYIAVESLYFNTNITNQFYVMAPTMPVQQSTVLGGFMNLLFTGAQTTFYKNILSNSIETPIHDIISLASSSMHRIQFLDTSGNLYLPTTSAVEWTMTLVLFKGP